MKPLIPHITRIAICVPLLIAVLWIGKFCYAVVDEGIDAKVISFDLNSKDESAKYLKKFRLEALKSWIIPVMFFLIVSGGLSWIIVNSFLKILKNLTGRIPIRISLKEEDT